jgi:hypothetical protein
MVLICFATDDYTAYVNGLKLKYKDVIIFMFIFYINILM